MKRVSLLFLLLALISASAVAGDLPELTLRIKGHQFIPAQMNVPANVKFKLIVVNEDPTPEEFESHELNREKVVTGNGKIVVYIGPLKPGRYPYFGDFNQKTAQGVLIAR
jgi:hypothetical protein